MFIKKFSVFLFFIFVAGYVQANDGEIVNGEIVKCEYYKYVVDFKRVDYNSTNQYRINEEIEHYKEKGYELVGYWLDQTNDTGELRVVKYDVKESCTQEKKGMVKKSTETIKGWFK